MAQIFLVLMLPLLHVLVLMHDLYYLEEVEVVVVAAAVLDEKVVVEDSSSFHHVHLEEDMASELTD